MLQLSLENERANLNRHIGEAISADVRIIYDIHDIEPVCEITRSEWFIYQQVERDPNLLHWIDQVEIRRYHMHVNRYNPEEDRQYNRVQHQIATFERNMAESAAEQNARAALYQWDRLIEQQEAILADIAAAQAEYENMQERLEAGFVIPLNVEQMRFALFAQEVRLARHSYEFWIARMRIDHPYLR
jgi:hypothetical protein